MIAGGNWWRANEIVMRHLIRQTDARHRSRDKTARTVAETGAALPLLQRLPQNVGEKAHQDVRQHAILALMPDGTDRQLALSDAKGRFRFRKLDIGPPQRLGAPVAQIGAQHVAAFAVTRPVVPFGASRPFESQASRQDLVVDETDRIARGGA